jgi:FkbM family methyltransferase
MVKNFLISQYKNIKRNKSKKIHKILNQVELKKYLKVLDIGAAGEIKENWRQFEPILDYVGIEPDVENYQKIKKNKNICKSYKIFNEALWDSKTKLNLNITKKRTNSSILEPNFNILNNFPDPERFKILEKKEINLSPLDDLKIENIDFIKIDTQGSELNILNGSSKTIKNVMGFEIEVSFVKIYKDQPLFSDIYHFMIKNNFQFMGFSDQISWKRDKADVGKNQLIFADAIFFKPFEEIIKYENNINEQLFKYSLICLSYNFLGLSKIINAKIYGSLNFKIDDIYTNILNNGKYKRSFKKILNKFKKIF